MRKLYWLARFFYNDLFNSRVTPQHGLTRWQLFIADAKYILS